MDVSESIHAVNPAQARMKLVETYLACGNIAETAQERYRASWASVSSEVVHLAESGPQVRSILPVLEGRTRLLSWGHELNLANSVCTLRLAMLWLRAFGIEREAALEIRARSLGETTPKKLERFQSRPGILLKPETTAL